MARWQPPHPARTVRPPLACPTGLARFTDRWRALASLPFVGRDTGFTPTGCAACGSWHLTPTASVEQT